MNSRRSILLPAIPLVLLMTLLLGSVALSSENDPAGGQHHAAEPTERLPPRPPVVLPDGSRLWDVEVLNNVFEPQTLAIAVGDTVRWTNTQGFHNVYSCTPTQSGCSVASNETFSNGPPAGPPWVYFYNFTEAGQNPYVCQSHAPSMTGLVVVQAPNPGPPPVPDGTPGSPMTVARLTVDASRLRITWDTTTCAGAAGYNILWGDGAMLPSAVGGSYSLAGSWCGVSSPFQWNGTPPTDPEATDLIWWLVVAVDEAGREGSWGQDGAGNERRGPAADEASGECGVAERDLGTACP